MKLITISLIGTIVFGLIDASFFLLGESYLQKKFNTITFFDTNMSELLTGGISASIALFITSIINRYLHKYYKLIENPFLDVIGILVGTIIILLVYYLLKKKEEKD